METSFLSPDIDFQGSEEPVLPPFTSWSDLSPPPEPRERVFLLTPVDTSATRKDRNCPSIKMATTRCENQFNYRADLQRAPDNNKYMFINDFY
jgi:hypothetical protein